MAGGLITFKIDDSQVVARIRATERAAQNMTPVFATIGRVLLARIKLCFMMGVDPWGSPWAALKLRRGQPLRDTGRLNRSFVARPDASGVTVGTNVSYARTHQFGAVIEPKRPGGRLVFPGPGKRLIFARRSVVPARSFLPVRPGSDQVALPVPWAIEVTRALRGYFQRVG